VVRTTRIISAKITFFIDIHSMKSIHSLPFSDILNLVPVPCQSSGGENGGKRGVPEDTRDGRVREKKWIFISAGSSSGHSCPEDYWRGWGVPVSLASVSGQKTPQNITANLLS
jgi:hypothetical protein